MLWNLTNVGVLGSISSPFILISGNIAYWKLDDTSWLDSTGNGYTLTSVNNNVALSGGIINNAAVFNGNTAPLTWLRSNNKIIPNTDSSIQCWFYCRQNLNGQNVMFLVGDFFRTPLSINLGQNTNNINAFVTCDWTNASLNASVTSPFNINTWYHVVATHDAVTKTLRMYVNGSLVGTSNYTGVPGTNLQDGGFAIGSTWDGFTAVNYTLNGFIDEVGVWNRVLNATEVTALYNNGNGLQFPFSYNLPVRSGLAYGILSNLGNSVFTYTSNLTSMFPAGNVPTILPADSNMPYQFYRINNPQGQTFFTFDRTTADTLSTFRLQTDFRIFGGADALWISCLNTQHHGSTGFMSASAVQGLDSLRGTSGGVRGALSVYIPAACCNDGQIRFWYSPSITGTQTMIGTFTPFNPRDGNAHRLITRYNFSGTTLTTNVTAVQNCNLSLSSVFTTSFTTNNSTIAAFNPRVGYLGLTGGIQGTKDVGNIILNYN